MQSPPTKLGENQKTNQKKKIFHWLVNALSEKQCPRPKAWNSRTCTTGFNSPEQKSRSIRKRSWNLVSVTNLTGACDEGTEPFWPCLLILQGIWTPTGPELHDCIFPNVISYMHSSPPPRLLYCKVTQEKSLPGTKKGGLWSLGSTHYHFANSLL